MGANGIIFRKEIKKATAGISLPPSQAKDQKKKRSWILQIVTVAREKQTKNWSEMVSNLRIRTR